MSTKKYEVTISDRGDTEWRLSGRLHREGGPAVQHASGHKIWYKHGQMHRDDGPAIIFAGSTEQGSASWFLNGLCHRKDDPAVIRPTRKEWWLNGKLHRDGAPAIVQFSNEFIKRGYTEWYEHGKRHREDGPAIEGGGFSVERNKWFLEGKEFSKEDHAAELYYPKVKTSTFGSMEEVRKISECSHQWTNHKAILFGYIKVEARCDLCGTWSSKKKGKL